MEIAKRGGKEVRRRLFSFFTSIERDRKMEERKAKITISIMKFSKGQKEKRSGGKEKGNRSLTFPLGLPGRHGKRGRWRHSLRRRI